MTLCQRTVTKDREQTERISTPAMARVVLPADACMARVTPPADACMARVAPPASGRMRSAGESHLNFPISDEFCKELWLPCCHIALSVDAGLARGVAFAQIDGYVTQH